ncbi:unnamed protein product [Agarophyton chilense]|eukprot:gb/GEZJ01002177.1/.p1 GENE.gb/GEZJ01002177.1/~~gb/GEZJ01002177.1/.p1  ORF type:complete len:200 (+),score=38.40 gb/GEZJ01002177.1/:510-1109(+)
MAGSVDTRNQAWASDTSRFGLKMLQKMGWSEGKGLGREENGRTDPLRAKKNFEKQGLGVSVVNTSAWDAPAQMAHGLNSVLAKLASTHSALLEQGADVQNEASRPVGFYARRAAQKNVKGYSADALREIFGGVAGVKAKTEENTPATNPLNAEALQMGSKPLRNERRKKKRFDKLGVSSKIHKPHKHDKKKRKRKYKSN